MRSKALFSFVALILGLAIVLFEMKDDGTAPASASNRTEASSEPRTSPAPRSSTVGFSSNRALEEHFEKHGREFGSNSAAEYLELAQELRDAPAGGAILEAVRDDGVITRFDKRSGAFLAFHSNRTIRTFFKPNDGQRYFERQLGKEH